MHTAARIYKANISCISVFKVIQIYFPISQLISLPRNWSSHNTHQYLDKGRMKALLSLERYCPSCMHICCNMSHTVLMISLSEMICLMTTICSGLNEFTEGNIRSIRALRNSSSWSNSILPLYFLYKVFMMFNMCLNLSFKYFSKWIRYSANLSIVLSLFKLFISTQSPFA